LGTDPFVETKHRHAAFACGFLACRYTVAIGQAIEQRLLHGSAAFKR
jgi:hypothetical protein